MKKRIGSMLLVLTMLCSLFSGLTVTASAEDSGAVNELYIGTTALVTNGTVTENSAEHATYDATTNTLTLNGVTVTEGYAYTGSTTAGIYASGDLSIILNGTNIIGNDAYSLSHGISVAGDLTISGTGSLTAYGANNGIVANGDDYSLTVNSGTIEVYGGKVGLRGGKNLTIVDGTITAQGGINKANNFGILASTGLLTIQGGDVTATNSNSNGGYGMKGATGIIIYDGTVTASGT